MPDAKPPYTGILHIRAEGSNNPAHDNFVSSFDDKKTTILIPLLSTDFYRGGNSRAKFMENSGK
jgi:hypothetical protein